MPKKLNSMSFRKNRRPTTWCTLETDLFYGINNFLNFNFLKFIEVLAATGTDFTLMHEFLPTRTRAEIKKKFNREEKMDPERINLVFFYFYFFSIKNYSLNIRRRGGKNKICFLKNKKILKKLYEKGVIYCLTIIECI